MNYLALSGIFWFGPMNSLLQAIPIKVHILCVTESSPASFHKTMNQVVIVPSFKGNKEMNPDYFENCFFKTLIIQCSKEG